MFESPELADLFDDKSELHYTDDETHNRTKVDPELAKRLVENTELLVKAVIFNPLSSLFDIAKQQKQKAAEHFQLCSQLYSSGAVEVLYRDAKDLRNNKEEYAAATDKLRLAKNIVDAVAEAKKQYPSEYPLVCVELGCNLLLLADRETSPGIKRKTIEEAIELCKLADDKASESGDPKSKEIRRVKAVAYNNLNYAYGLLAKMSTGEEARRYQRESDGYKTAEDVCEELNLRIF